MPAELTRSPKLSNSVEKTFTGPGSKYVGFHPVHTTTCQKPMTMPTASSLGQMCAQRRTRSPGRGRSSISRASKPAISASLRDTSRFVVESAFAMACHLGPELVGDGRGQGGDGR